jgi:LysM repeat protein
MEMIIMNCIIPFESKVNFKNPVKEICSISLEHEITKNESELLGNFFVTGTYKEHELSVNTTDFKFTIPFSVELTNRVDINTLEFNIDNFTYELNNDELLIKIDYIINADDLQEDRVDLIENPLDLIEVKDDNNAEVNINEIKSEEITTQTKEKIVNNMSLTDDLSSYHVYIVKENDTIETISKKYNIDKDDLCKINDKDSINSNDILLIPLNYE